MTNPVPRGRRAYDPTEDLSLAYLEERLARVFEDKLKDTRHEIRGEIAELSVQLAQVAANESREHAEFKVSIVNLDREISELKPLHTSVARLERDELVDETREAEGDRTRRTIWKAATAVAGLITTLVGAYIASGGHP